MSKPIRQNRIAWKLIKALIVFSSLVTLLTTALQLWTEYDRDMGAIDARFHQVERGYLDSLSENVWEADQSGIDLLLHGIIEFPDFKQAVVRDEKGESVAQAGALAEGESVLKRSYPLSYVFRGERRAIGALEVAASLETVYGRALDRVGLILLSNAVKTALVATFLFMLVSWLLTRHIEAMADFARSLDFRRESPDLELDRGAYAGGRDEVDDLARSLSEMKRKLFDSYAELRQFKEELEVRVRGRTKALTEEIEERKKTARKLAASEERLRDIAEAASDWMWETGPDMRFTFLAGNAASGMLPQESVIGRLRTDLAADLDDRGKWDRHMADLQAHRPFRDFQYQLRAGNGEILHVRISGKPIFAEDGSFQGYRGVSANITAQVKAEEKAARALEELRVLSAAIEQNPSMVFITDSKGDIQFVNQKFTEITGYAPGEVIGRNPRLLKSPNTPKVVHDALWASIINGQAWRGEIQDRRKDGSLFWAYATIAPVKTAGGEITHFVATHEDITLIKEREALLRDATERAEVASRTKSELMANMSHELRTPLNAIIGFSDTMLNGVFGPLANTRYEEYVKDIHDSGRHLLDLINDILDVSAIEAGRLELRPEPLDVESVSQACLRLVAPRADNGKVRLEHHVEKDIPHLLADERRVKQILLNLLSNAVKFTPEGGRVTLTATLAADGGMRFEVVDTGIGMDEAGIAIALTQFGQVDSKLARKYEGTGLGLPLSKNLVEAHGGTLDIRSRLDHGTTVTVYFPPERVLTPPPPGEAERAEDADAASRTLH